MMIVCDSETALKDKTGLEIAAGAGIGVQALIDMTCDPNEIRRAGWVGRKETVETLLIDAPLWEDKDGGKGYKSAEVDHIVLLPGDFITVRPGHDEAPVIGRKMSLQSDAPSASIWFARITYIFDQGDGDPCAHVRWLTHGGDTILRETAGPRELFLLDRCDNIPLGSIAGKIKVRMSDYCSLAFSFIL
jgi:hypothetical protein